MVLGRWATAGVASLLVGAGLTVIAPGATAAAAAAEPVIIDLPATVRASPRITRIVADLPDGVRGDVGRRLRRSVDQVVRDGQRLVADYLKSINPTDKEIAGDWPRVADFLLSQPLQEWRELSAFLVKLDDPKAEGPAEATAAFLRRPTFELDFKQLRLRIPDALSDAKCIGRFATPVEVAPSDDRRPRVRIGSPASGVATSTGPESVAAMAPASAVPHQLFAAVRVPPPSVEALMPLLRSTEPDSVSAAPPSTLAPTTLSER